MAEEKERAGSAGTFTGPEHHVLVETGVEGLIDCFQG